MTGRRCATACARATRRLLGWPRSRSASLALERGRYRDAERWLNEAEAQLERSDTFDTLFCIRALQVGIACVIGDVAAAQARAGERAGAASRATGAHAAGRGRGYAACAEGWGARALGDAGGARRFQEEAAARRGPQRAAPAALRSAAAPADVRAALAAELTELADALRQRAVVGARRVRRRAGRAGRRGAAWPPRATSRRRSEPMVCAMAARRSTPRGSFVDAGTAGLGAQGSGDRRATCIADGPGDGVSRSSTGWPASRLTCRRARPRSPRSPPVGCPTHEIADQLVLSVRTVETYVYRAMQKRDVRAPPEL